MTKIHLPSEIVRNLSDSGVEKANRQGNDLLILGFLAGAYISLAGLVSQIISHDIAAYLGVGMTRFVMGTIFTLGLAMVVIAGAELFTGNCLMIISVLDRRISWSAMLRNWAIVFLANGLGSALVVALAVAGQAGSLNDGAAAQYAVDIAASKMALPGTVVFLRGILANWLVCLAVWMAGAAKDVAGKILAIYLPIMGFVAANFEHSIANMFAVPYGLAQAHALDFYNLGQFLLHNLLPATIGNIVGGAVLVGGLYWYVFARER
jgi:formate/nitrite transporter